MKILIVTHYFAPHQGGIENVALNQAAILANLGHKVTVVTSAIPKGSDTRSSSYTIIRIPAINVLEEKIGLPYPIFSPRLFAILCRQVKAADVVHAHGHVYMASVLAAFLARHHGKPFVLTQHNTFVGYSSPLLRQLQRLADASLGRFTIRRSSKIIVVSKATQDYVQSIYPTNSIIHYNGVDLGRFHPVQDRTAIRRRLSIPEDRTVCLCVRRVTFKNGIGTLLDAAAKLQDINEILFLICGDGADLEAARSRVSTSGFTNVMITGPVSDVDLPSYYASSDLFILPSRMGEGFPLVILEALASGLPIIATRSGGHVEILETQRCGELIEPDNPLEIAELLRLKAAQPEPLKATGERSRKVAESSFSWNKNVEDLLTIFAEALDESKS